MNPIYNIDPLIEDFIRSRRASARSLQLGTPSLAVVIIERAAHALHRFAAAVEDWATGSSETAVPRQLSTR